MWKSERLFKPFEISVQQRLFAAAKTLLLCDTFPQTVAEASVMAWFEIKAWSHEGFVYRKKKSCDEGNYAYSILFFTFLKVARGARRDALHGLVNVFPGLMPFDGDNEDHMMERQGDIIECMLAKASLTGLAIGRRDRLDRMRFHQKLKEFMDDFLLLTQCLCGEYVPCMYRPPTRNVVQELSLVLHRDGDLAISVQSCRDGV
jgi:hypothetical protein